MVYEWASHKLLSPTQLPLDDTTFYCHQDCFCQSLLRDKQQWIQVLINKSWCNQEWYHQEQLCIWPSAYIAKCHILLAFEFDLVPLVQAAHTLADQAILLSSPLTNRDMYFNLLALLDFPVLTHSLALYCAGINNTL